MMKRSWIGAISMVTVLVVIVLMFPNVLDKTETSIVQIRPLDEKVKTAVEMIESGSGNPMEAIFALREVVDVDSNHRDAQFHLGQFSVMSGQFDKAISRFIKVLKIDPSDVSAIEALAKTKFQMGDIQGAIVDLKYFLDSYPSTSRASELKTMMLSFQGESQSEVYKVQ